MREAQLLYCARRKGSAAKGHLLFKPQVARYNPGRAGQPDGIGLNCVKRNYYTI